MLSYNYKVCILYDLMKASACLASKDDIKEHKKAVGKSQKLSC